ncbi:hypothetical protein HBH98_118070 [Parastagonospora nodorum]|nr:hypothetical protein HBI09_033400 [Parastagonospora nodorum]KAH4345332.1 hypothetical protein HBH98_118070 [Parastagonospora nodorum]KAH4375768.1 hypothetical protein HBH97_119710 [Parastagonospora nodorum]KAH4395455.1 hypothetical protein HBH99_134370 [Parastagonospora nodorum]KAH4959080.1 hypothetical protein HBI78_173350 [Parastagonospora nodorum]
MLTEPGVTDGKQRAKHTHYDRLKDYILDQLPVAYGRHNSSNVLKGFSIQALKQGKNFAVTAVAILEPPASLGIDFEVLLEDNFIMKTSEISALDAMQQLLEEVNEKIDQERTDPYGVKEQANPFSIW